MDNYIVILQLEERSGETCPHRSHNSFWGVGASENLLLNPISSILFLTYLAYEMALPFKEEDFNTPNNWRLSGTYKEGV